VNWLVIAGAYLLIGAYLLVVWWVSRRRDS